VISQCGDRHFVGCGAIDEFADDALVEWRAVPRDACCALAV